MTRTLSYVRLEDVKTDPRNPKAHARDTIEASVERFGFVDPLLLDGRTGQIISGHGRLRALREMENAGADAPEGIEVDQHGFWTVPIIQGWSSQNDEEAAAALIAVNRANELGGWNNRDLLGLLEELQAADALDEAVGFTEGDMKALEKEIEKMLGSLMDDDASTPSKDDTEDFSSLTLTYTHDEYIEVVEALGELRDRYQGAGQARIVLSLIREKLRSIEAAGAAL